MWFFVQTICLEVGGFALTLGPAASFGLVADASATVRELSFFTAGTIKICFKLISSFAIFLLINSKYQYGLPLCQCPKSQHFKVVEVIIGV